MSEHVDDEVARIMARYGGYSGMPDDAEPESSLCAKCGGPLLDQTITVICHGAAAHPRSGVEYRTYHERCVEDDDSLNGLRWYDLTTGAGVGESGDVLRMIAHIGTKNWCDPAELFAALWPWIRATVWLRY